MRGRTFPGEPYCSERQRMAEERRKQQAITNAQQHSSVLRRIRMEQEYQQSVARASFILWSMADRRLEKLEEQRDAHKPQPGDDWDENFCDAVRQIPEARRLCNDLWFAWCNSDRDDAKSL